MAYRNLIYLAGIISLNAKRKKIHTKFWWV